MQYSFDLWNQPVPAATNEPAHRDFPFTEDLAELEASLSMQDAAWDEPEAWSSPQTDEPAGPVEEDWDQLAEVVAAHVLAYMQGVQSQDEIERWQKLAEEYREDNRIMARQVRELLKEKEQLTRRLAGYEIELARYRPLAGNLHIKW